MSHSADPTTSVLLTPRGRGAVASVGVIGPSAEMVVAQCFERRGGRSFSSIPIGQVVLGRWKPMAEDAAGEEVVVCRRDPANIEIHCHGGQAAAGIILESLRGLGVLSVDWRKWAAQGYDPICAAALESLSRATTERTAALLLDQFHGALRHELSAIAGLLEQGNAAEAVHRLDSLIAWSDFGRHLTEPYRVVLSGRPNVGKSSLINALVGYQRAIVFDQPGTTRDVVTAATAIDGWPVELADTAGLREGGDTLEAAGMGLARNRLRGADLVILVFEAGRWLPDDERLAAECPGALHVFNKADLAAERSRNSTALHASALTGEGLDRLIAQIAKRLVPEVPETNQPLPFTAEQVAAIRAARTSFESGQHTVALQHFEQLLGSSHGSQSPST